jgi:hypothetical protein
VQGRDYRSGQRSRRQPFASNPTFRPPPPLSNDLQTLLHADVVKGTKTVGQLAEQYNVSKARIEAIRKLKAVEKEFRRQVGDRPRLFHHLVASSDEKTYDITFVLKTFPVVILIFLHFLTLHIRPPLIYILYNDQS